MPSSATPTNIAVLDSIDASECIPTLPTSGDVTFRCFPFPFRSALAIVNDSRGVSLEAFEDYHSAFAAESIEVGDSFSLESVESISVSTGRVRELVKARLLDVLVGGDQTNASEVGDQLSSLDIAPTCYLAATLFDDCGPLLQAGLRFFSDSSWLSDSKFGDDLNYRVRPRLMKAVAQFNPTEFANSALGCGGGVGKLLAATSGEDLRALWIALFNRPTHRVALPGGNALTAFKRYRGGQAPACTTLPLQLRSNALDTLEAMGGVVLVAQRLGEWALIGRASAYEARTPAQAPVFGFHELACLSDVGERVRSGRLFVATPGRLLDWLALRESIVFETSKLDSKWHVRIQGVRQPHTNRLRSLAPGELNGLAFTVPNTAPEILVTVTDGVRPLPVTRKSDPNVSDSDAVFLPWEPLEWPNP